MENKNINNIENNNINSQVIIDCVEIESVPVHSTINNTLKIGFFVRVNSYKDNQASNHRLEEVKD